MKASEYQLEEPVIKISVVIPCFNESESINELIKQLEIGFVRGDTQRRYRFILVDDGSTDTTWACIGKYCRAKNREA